MAPPPPPKLRINLETAVVLVVDNSLGLDILTSIFLAFGVRNLHRGRTVAEAKSILETHQIDLIVVESLMAGEDTYQFIETLRRSEQDVNRFVPVVMLSAHTAASRVKKGRDCGANFLIGKPISAKVLIQRILWVARDKRQFLESDSYAGPDRRFHDAGPPEGAPGRRRNDVQQTAQDTAPDAVEVGNEDSL